MRRPAIFAASTLCFAAAAVAIALADPAVAGILQSTYLGDMASDVRDMIVDPTNGEIVITGLAGAQGYVARLSPDLSEVRHMAALSAGSLTLGWRLALDPGSGDIIVSGENTGGGFPGTAGGAFPDPAGESDRFIARFSGDLSVLRQATYFGGSGSESDDSMAFDPVSGDIVIGGGTDSRDLPGTAGAVQPNGMGPGFTGEGYVARFSGDLRTLRRATYIGGTLDDGISAVAVDPADGDVVIAGEANSKDYPNGPPSFEVESKGFVARLSPDLSAYDGFLQINRDTFAPALRFDPSTGDLLVGGVTSADVPGVAGGAQSTRVDIDGVVARIPSSFAIAQASYFGGTGREGAQSALAIDPGSGDVFVATETETLNFPATAGGAQPGLAGHSSVFVDVVIARLTGALDRFVQATYLGGTKFEALGAMAIDPTTGDVIVAGQTGSFDFPTTAGVLQPNFLGSTTGFVSRISADLRAGPPAATPTITPPRGLTPSRTPTPTGTASAEASPTASRGTSPTGTASPTARTAR